MAVARSDNPRRARIFSHLIAGVAAAPLLLTSVFADEIHKLAEEFEISLLGQELPVRLAKLSILPDAAPELATPPEFADLMLAHDQASAIATAALSPPPALPEALRPGAPLTLPEPPPHVAALPNDLIAVARKMAQPQARAVVPAVTEADLALMKLAIAEYKKVNLAAGDEIARRVSSDTARLALEWAAVRLGKQTSGVARLMAFSAANPTFPQAPWIVMRAEEALFIARPAPATTLAFFSARAPQTGPGKIALARALAATGHADKARALVTAAWRDDKTNRTLRAAVAADFPGLITAADQRYLAQRLIYDGEIAEGLAVAADAGPQTRQLAELLAASINESAAAPGLIAKLDLGLRNEPAALFARAQNLRRTGKIVDAAKTLLSAPNDADRIIDGDEWWTERRMLSRKLLDMGEMALAYKIVAAHHAEGSAARVDAEVHAGWLALRFLNDADKAAAHFAAARAAALTPPSLARAEYWQGRAAEALGDPYAGAFHLAAGGHGHTYYGQLALARIGQPALPDPNPDLPADALRQAAAGPALRVIRALIDADARDVAMPLITDLAKVSGAAAEVVALGDLLAQYREARLTLLVGKLALQRGLTSEEHAFPTFGVPEFDRSPHSAEAAIVYSIARQESEFDAKVVSHAGARGLMQMMPATARLTAARQKLPFDVGKLTADPAYNARLGAAHLGDLFGEYGGSYILSFAAYNAGGGRVREWTTAYGDPRDPNVDKVDWIERIPITETRHYVQKVMENLQMYRVRLSGQRALGIAADMTRGARAPKFPREGGAMAEAAPSAAARPVIARAPVDLPASPPASLPAAADALLFGVASDAAP